MASSSIKIATGIMLAMGIYALVVSLSWIFVTEVAFVSDYKAYTDQSLADALAAGSKSAELWLVVKRMMGVELLPISILMIFVTQKSYSKAEKWSWFALLISGAITWGSMIGYRVVIGYFQATASSMTFIIPAILLAIGLLLPAKEIFGKKST